MLKTILSAEIQNFINDHENDDEKQLVLKHKDIFGIPANIIAEQIAGRRKAKTKLPLYYNTPGIIYPPGINLEQSSSQQTASYKSLLLSEALTVPLQGDRPKQSFGQGVDLTGGFGIDTFFLSRIFSTIDYVEPNSNLAQIAKHNYKVLGADNIIHHNTTAERFLHELKNHVDLIFIDPSRRFKNKKVLTLKDSEPDIIPLQAEIFEKTDHLLIKASPLLDMKLGIKELLFVKQVFVVAVDNEVKELLFYAEKGFINEPCIKAVNLNKNEPEVFELLFSEERAYSIQFSNPLTFIYEPNASILKAGAFKTIAARFNLKKVHPNTHFYTSESLYENFPGRIFKIERQVKPVTRELKVLLPELKANIITRNYPLNVDELKKKTKLQDGGEKYLIGFSGVKEKFLVVADRIK